MTQSSRPRHVPEFRFLATTIYVRLLDEGTDVWRPVDAEMIAENIYRLVGRQEGDENWEFDTGCRVRVEERSFTDHQALVAVMAID